MKALVPLTLLLVLLLSGGIHLPGFCQTSQQSFEKEPSLPKVFKLGEHDKQYEDIMPGYQTLLDACDGDMHNAYKKLYGMMKEMEKYAGRVQFDLNGINAWMHFFWKPDGSIDHIGFHLKPNSRNVETKALQKFLDGFAAQYTFPHTATIQFAHYSTFSFPVL